MRTPPESELPEGATEWATVNDVAIATEHEVRTVKHWCAKGLVHTFELVGGYGGLWIAARNGWPVTNAAGIAKYRERRRESARVGARIGAARSVAVRMERRAARAKKSSKSAERS